MLELLFKFFKLNLSGDYKIVATKLSFFLKYFKGFKVINLKNLLLNFFKSLSLLLRLTWKPIFKRTSYVGVFKLIKNKKNI